MLDRFFDLGVTKHAFAKQNIVTLKERASWNGHVLVAEHEKQGDADPVQALLAAKRKAHGAIPRARITCISNLIIGYGEGRATREIDVHVLNLINKICEVRLKTPFCLQCQIKLEFTLSVKQPWGKQKKSTILKQKKNNNKNKNIYIYFGRKKTNKLQVHLT